MNGFRKRIEVDVHDVDFNGVCRVSSLMKYIQSTAQQQLTENGMSYDQLKDMHRAFIISKIRLEFTEPIYTYDRLEAETFPCVSRGYSFLRCYALYKNGEPIGRAISVWALIDTENRSLVKVGDFDLNLSTFEPWDMPIGHIRLPSSMTKVGEYVVSYADLDRNKHINNTKYADIFASFIPLDKKRIDSITISYVNEAKFKDKLDVFLEKSGDLYYVRTVREDGKINAEAEIHTVFI